MELNKDIVDMIAESVDREWLLSMQTKYYTSACISRMCAAGNNDWQKDYAVNTAYGNMCNARLFVLRIDELREAQQERNTENEKV